LNDDPVIGIVAQPLSDYMKGSKFENYTYYIDAAYVKWVEASGARVVPLIESEGEEVMLQKLSKLNGVLFPGGGSNYRVFAGQIYEKVVEFNDEGQVYPLWGTCLGFQYMVRFASKGPTGLPSILKKLTSKKEMLTLDFMGADVTTSKMFGELDNFDIDTLKDEPLTYNSHNWGVSLD